MPKRPRGSTVYCRRTHRRRLLAQQNHPSSSDSESQGSSSEGEDNHQQQENNLSDNERVPEPFYDESSDAGSSVNGDGDNEGEPQPNSENDGSSQDDDDSNSSDSTSSDSELSESEGEGFPYDSPSSPSDSDDSDDDNNFEEDPPLYAGAPLTLAESMLAILSLVLAHNLSGTCLADVLELVAMHCPAPNQCQTSLYKFKKFFSRLKLPLVRRYYCSVCLTALDNRDDFCEQCNARRGVSYFLETPVIPQVKALYKRPGFYEKVTEFQNRRNGLEVDFSDISDGSVYKSLRQQNQLGHGNKFSLMWYTDGVRIFRSTKAELWPFFLTINELPYKDRTKLENIIFAGLWFGSNKPRPSLFLRHIRDDLITLRNGIDVSLPNGNEIIRVHGTVMCGTCDLPAKAAFLNTKYFNSTWGCQICRIQTQPVEDNNLHRMYPFRRILDLRTDEETRIFARTAVLTGRPVQGIKGPSALSPFVQNPIEWTAVDVLHCCYLGLGKKLATIWFTEKFDDHPASMFGWVRLIDQRLLAICPPYFVQRRARTITDHLKWWKGSEFKNWLMIYSLPILQDIMPNNLLQHHVLLVMGLHLLSMDSVSQESLELATRVLTEYVSRFQFLYGREHMTANVHCLLHLPLTVSKFGPLWTTSCFPMESVNGVLKKLVSGTKFADLQIHSAASMFLNLSAFKTARLVPGRPVSEYCAKLAQPNKKLPLSIITGSLAVVGRYFRANGFPNAIEQAIEDLGFENNNIFVFHRLFNYKKKYLFASVAYTRVAKTNGTCVRYLDNGGREKFGIVHYFLRITQCQCQVFCHNCDPTFHAVIRECRVAHAFRTFPGGSLQYIHRSTLTHNYFAIDVGSLQCVCFLIHVQDINQYFIVEPLNSTEVE